MSSGYPDCAFAPVYPEASGGLQRQGVRERGPVVHHVLGSQGDQGLHEVGRDSAWRRKAVEALLLCISLGEQLGCFRETARS